MEAPAYYIHGLNVKAQVMVQMLDTKPVEQSEVFQMLSMLAGSIAELAGALEVTGAL